MDAFLHGLVMNGGWHSYSVIVRRSVLLWSRHSSGDLGTNKHPPHNFVRNTNALLAAQIQDDYLDAFGDPEVIGKIGTDVEDNKCSWLVVQALERASPEQRAVIEVPVACDSAICSAGNGSSRAWIVANSIWEFERGSVHGGRAGLHISLDETITVSCLAASRP